MELPTDLKKRLKSCRMRIAMAKDSEFSKEKAIELKSTLLRLHDEVIEFYAEIDDDNDDGQIPEEFQSKVKKYTRLIDDYIKSFSRESSEENSSSISDSNTEIVSNNSSNGHSPVMLNNDRNIENANDAANTNRIQPANNAAINPPANRTFDFDVANINKDWISFNGNYSQWPSYKKFIEDAVINNNRIGETQKIATLLKTTIGEPYELIKLRMGCVYSIDSIWSEFCSNYDDPDNMVIELKSSIHRLEKVRNERDVSNWRKLSQVVNNVEIVLNKLNQVSSREFIDAVAEKLYHQDKWIAATKCKKFSDIAKLVRERYQDAATAAHSTIIKNEDRELNKRNQTNLQTRQPIQRIVQRPSVSSINVKICDFCDKSHQNIRDQFECVRSMDPTIVSATIRNKNLCFKCLRKNHRSKDCRQRFECNICHRQHATEMHAVSSIKINASVSSITANTPDANNNENQQTNTINSGAIINSISSIQSTIDFQNQPIESASACSIINRPINIFKIMKLGESESRPMIFGTCNDKRCRLLLDDGSNVSLIHKNLILENSTETSILMYSSSPMGGHDYNDQKTSLKICDDKTSITIDVRLCNLTEEDLIIIGTDNLAKFYDNDINDLKKETKFGTVKFRPRQWAKVNSIENKYYTDNEYTTDQLREIIDEPTELSDCSDDLIIEKTSTGRYQTRLPFLSDVRPINNFDAALSNLKRLIIVLKKKNIFDVYEKQLMQYLNDDQAVEVYSKDGYFLPHHHVFRDSPTTPIRVVFNGSFGQQSINETLWKGVARNLDIFKHLIQFRLGRYAVTADLSKAFLQILIHPDDQKYLRYMWINSNNELKTYQLKVLPFGLISSPAILTAVTKRLLCDNDLHRTADAIYMDDIILANDNETDLKLEIKKVHHCFNASGFKLQKGHSNSATVQEIFEETQTDRTTVLGIVWEKLNDRLCHRETELQTIRTKRDLLSTIGKIFDPYGVLDPWKLLLRSEFRKIIGLDWDEKLPDGVMTVVNRHIENYTMLFKISIERRIWKTGEIHGFSDASADAYGYVIYQKVGDRFNFILGKSKIAPQKRDITIVQLELLALSEMTKMLVKIKDIVGLPTIAYSDSQSNIDRLKSSPNGQKKQIATQLFKLMKLINHNNIQVHHIAGKYNPADLFSRIVSTKVFLKKFKPTIEASKLIGITTPPTLVYKVLAVSADTFEYYDHIDDFKKLTSITEIFKFIDNLIEKPITTIERWNIVHRFAQADFNPDSTSTNIENIDGILRVRTREPTFSPVFIPPESNLVPALIDYYHEKCLHGGVKTTCAHIKSVYSIKNLDRKVRRRIGNCKTCKRLNGSRVQQPFAQLPVERTEFIEPFKVVSIDFFGPLQFRNGKNFYGLLLTCFSSRMIIIELVKSLNTTATKIALTNIFARVGMPSYIHSDNGTSFRKCSKDLQILFNNLTLYQQQSIEPIKWSFCSPYAPWQNGCAERMIGIVKKCLFALNQTFASMEEARSTFLQIESTINNRPIIQDDTRWLTPFEIAYGRKSYPSVIDTFIYTDKLWCKQLIEKRDKFKLLWQSQYLEELRKITAKKETTFKIGDEVLIPEILKKRKDWPIAKVISVKKSSDGIVREVTLDLDKKIITRPTNGLVHLGRECDVTDHEASSCRENKIENCHL